MMSRTRVTRIALLLMLLLTAGCSRSPRAVFYTLNAGAAADSAPFTRESVAIGPVTLPDLLDRPQLVVRTSANQVDILETHRWAESLKSEIPRIIGENLDLLLKPALVSMYPQNAGTDAGYRITLDIQRFDMTEEKGVRVAALWSVRRVDNGTVKSGRTDISESVTAAGFEPLVAAQSRALTAVSRDLARTLRELAAPAR